MPTGTGFYGGGPELVMGPGGGRGHNCNTLLNPAAYSPAVLPHYLAPMQGMQTPMAHGGGGYMSSHGVFQGGGAGYYGDYPSANYTEYSAGHGLSYGAMIETCHLCA